MKQAEAQGWISRRSFASAAELGGVFPSAAWWDASDRRSRAGIIPAARRLREGRIVVSPRYLSGSPGTSVWPVSESLAPTEPLDVAVEQATIAERAPVGIA
jgi:hypothetical protein